MWTESWWYRKSQFSVSIAVYGKQTRWFAHGHKQVQLLYISWMEGTISVAKCHF
jgi:hypothetical protein